MTRLTIAAAVLLLTTCAREPSLADLERQGASALRDGDFVSAGRAVDAGERIAEGRHDAAWQARFRVLHAELLVEQGLPGALALVDDPAGPSAADDLLNVRLLIARGRAHCQSGDIDAIGRGEHDLDAAGRLAAALPPGEVPASISLYRGNCALSRVELARAEREFRQTYAAAQAFKLPQLEAKAAGSIGLTLTKTYRYDEAMTWLERARAGSPNDFVRVKTLVNLGWCQYALGDFPRALTFLVEADGLAQARGYDGPRQKALQMAGDASYRLHDRAHAADAFQRSLAIARQRNDSQSAAELLGNLAIVALDQQQLEASHALVDEALRIKSAKGYETAIAHSLLTEGQIRAAGGDLAGADGYLRGVLLAPRADPDLLWEARAALAQLRVRMGRPDEADAEFRRAFDLIEQSAASVRRTDHRLSFYSSIDEVQDAYVDFLVSRGDDRRALEVADTNRARLLRERLQPGVSAPPTAAAEQFQRSAAAVNSVILFYWLAPARSFVWAVSAGGIVFKVLPGEEAIAAHVDAYQRLLLRSGDPLAENDADARWLYETLVEPVRAAVPRGSRVVFVPDGALYQLNPETLVAGAPAPHYWIEDATISIAPSISVLTAAPAPTAAARSILIVGDPLSSGPEFPRLAHAADEIERISGRFSPDHRRVFAGAKAEPRSYLEADPARYAFIHFAAHGVANREVPLDSAVVLSPADDRSKLYARDILGVPIQADLVTISACRGAGSRTYAGEGLVGLTWAFLTSGARNVIAALWNVDDASTAALMDDLYGQLARGDGPADALRHSKLTLLASRSAYRKPFYWAPFLTYTRSPIAASGRAASSD